MRITPVILSGGSGTRLWPVSTADRPKQFHALLGANSLLQETALRAEALGLTPPIVICAERDQGQVEHQLARVGVEAAALITEPVGRNTAPAVAAASLVGDGLILVMPADHLITDLGALESSIRVGAEAAGDGNLVVFGIVPTRPETGYGYIEQASPGGSWARVERFTEKPDAEMAARFVEAGHLWNSGMFLFHRDTALAEFTRWAPDVLDAVREALPEDSGRVIALADEFSTAPSIAFDRAVMEKTDRAAVVPLAAGWSDMGSWRWVWELAEKDGDQNAVQGDPILLDVKESLIRAGDSVVVIGLERVVVVEHEGKVLIASMDASQRVGDLPVHG